MLNSEASHFNFSIGVRQLNTGEKLFHSYLNFSFRRTAAEDVNPILSLTRQELLNTGKAVCGTNKEETRTYSEISHRLNQG